MRPTVAALLTLGLSLSPFVFAHDDATLDAMPSPNGGQVRMAGPYHFELVLGDGVVNVYLTDHSDAPVASEGVSGSAIILSGSRATIDLTPSGDSRLDGQGAFEVGPDMRAVVALTFPDGETWQARFTPWERMQTTPSATQQKEANAGEHHQH